MESAVAETRPSLLKSPSAKFFIGYFSLALTVKMAFLASGVFLKSPYACLLGDSWILHKMASSYHLQGSLLYMDSFPTLTQLPLYPLIISYFYKFFGPDPRFVLIAQNILAASIIPLFSLSLKKYLGNKIHLLSLILIFDIHSLLYSSSLLTEFMVCSLWLLAWLSFSRFEKKDQSRYLFIFFILLGLAANTKPITLYLPLFITFVFLIFKLSFLRKNWKVWTLGLTLFLLSLAPLLVRNYIHTHEFPRYSTISSFNLWYFNIPYFESIRFSEDLKSCRLRQVMRMKDYLESQNRVTIPPISLQTANDRRAHVLALGLNEYEYAKVADHLSSEYFKDHGLAYLTIHLIQGFNIFTVSNLSVLKQFYGKFDAYSFSGKRGLKALSKADISTFFLAIRILEVLATFFLLFLFIGGFFISFKKFISSPFLILGLIFIVYIWGVTGLNTWGRFRYLFIPQLVFLGVWGWIQIQGKFMAKKNI